MGADRGKEKEEDEEEEEEVAAGCSKLAEKSKSIEALKAAPVKAASGSIACACFWALNQSA